MTCDAVAADAKAAKAAAAGASVLGATVATFAAIMTIMWANKRNTFPNIEHWNYLKF